MELQGETFITCAKAHLAMIANEKQSSSTNANNTELALNYLDRAMMAYKLLEAYKPLMEVYYLQVCTLML